MSFETKNKFFSLDNNLPLAKKVADHLGVETSDIDITRFADNEVYVRIKESVRGKRVWIMQSLTPNPNDAWITLLVALDALRRASASEINVIIPYFSYGRSDRKAASREPISAKLLANLLSDVGINRMITLDLHADQIQGFFDIPLDHFYAAPILGHWFFENDLVNDNLMVVAPDHSTVGLARKYAKLFNCELSVVDRRHGKVINPQNDFLDVIPSTQGKNVVIVDDLIDTGFGMCVAASAVKKQGANKIYSLATHGIFSQQALNQLENSPIDKIIVSDSIDNSQYMKQYSKLHIISIAELLANGINKAVNYESVESLLRSNDNPEVTF